MAACTMVFDDLARCVMARHRSDATAGMGAGTTHVESTQRRAVIAESEQRSRRPDLIEPQRAMEYIDDQKSEALVQFCRRECQPADDVTAEVRRIGIHRVDDVIRRGL